MNIKEDNDFRSRNKDNLLGLSKNTKDEVTVDPALRFQSQEQVNTDRNHVTSSEKRLTENHAEMM